MLWGDILYRLRSHALTYTFLLVPVLCDNIQCNKHIVLSVVLHMNAIVLSYLACCLSYNCIVYTGYSLELETVGFVFLVMAVNTFTVLLVLAKAVSIPTCTLQSRMLSKDNI